MTSLGNVAANLSTKEVEGDDKMKTLECLRGRLLAERAVSRAANEEADKLGNKLNELENKLKEEAKLRKRAEKRLRSLTKKLESMKIVHVISDESSTNHSSPLEKSDLSSLSSSSTAYSFSYPDKQKKKPNSPDRNSLKCELDKAVEKDGSTLSEMLKHSNADSGASAESQSFTSSEKISSDKTISEKSDDHSQCTQTNYDEKRDDCSSKSSFEDKETNGEKQSFTSGGKISSDKTISEKSDDHSQCSLSNYDEKLDDYRYVKANRNFREFCSYKSSVEDKETNGQNCQDWDGSSVDNSMALVTVDIPASTEPTNITIEPLIAANSGVKDVLDTLRYVKEGLRSSMDRRRHMIRAGY